MNQAVLSISALCVLAALCSQLMVSSTYTGVVRLVLGLEILKLLLSMIQNGMHMLI